MRTVPLPRKHGNKSIPQQRHTTNAHRVSAELLLTAGEMRHLLSDLREFIGDLENQARRVRKLTVSK